MLHRLTAPRLLPPPRRGRPPPGARCAPTPPFRGRDQRGARYRCRDALGLACCQRAPSQCLPKFPVRGMARRKAQTMVSALPLGNAAGGSRRAQSRTSIGSGPRFPLWIPRSRWPEAGSAHPNVSQLLAETRSGPGRSSAAAQVPCCDKTRGRRTPSRDQDASRARPLTGRGAAIIRQVRSAGISGPLFLPPPCGQVRRRAQRDAGVGALGHSNMQSPSLDAHHPTRRADARLPPRQGEG
jgi:hypothetical protein